MLKECLLIYISSASAAAGIKMFLHRAYNLPLTAIRRDRGTKTINVNFPKGDVLVGLKKFSTNNGINGMRESKAFDQLDSVFPFIVAFDDKATGAQHQHPVTALIFERNPILYSKRQGSAEGQIQCLL